MSKALLFTDLHIHAHKKNVDRLKDCLEVLEWVFQESQKHECEHILFLGDLFHERAKIDVLNYLRTFEVFWKYMGDNSQQDMYLLVGNHDMYHRERWDVNSVKPLTAVSNVHIVDSPSMLEIGGRRIDFLPHTEDPIKELADLKRGRDKKDLTLLLAHIAVHGATLNTLYGTTADVIVEYDTGMVPVDVSIFDDWDQTFLGHYHGGQNLNNHVEYIGSPLQLTFGEAFQEKRVVVLDLKTLEKKYLVNDFSPKHYIISKDDIGKYNLKDSFTRVVVDDISAEDLVNVKRDLTKNHGVATFDFKQKEHKSDEDEAQIDEAKAILFKQDEMMEEWIKETGVPEGLDEERLLKYGREVIEVPEDK